MGVDYVIPMQNVLHTQRWFVLRELAISNNRIILHSCFTGIYHFILPIGYCFFVINGDKLVDAYKLFHEDVTK